MSFEMIRSEVPINVGAPSISVGKNWFRFFANLWTATVRGSSDIVTTISATASPMVYTATTRGQVIVSGGTVSAIAISRDGTTFYTTGQTAGVFPLSYADQLRITYTVTPTTLVFVPL